MNPFQKCTTCTDGEECEAARICFAQVHLEAFEEQERYIAAGVCSDCGACSLTEARNKCKPRSLGDTGDYICAGEPLWEDQDQ